MECLVLPLSPPRAVIWLALTACSCASGTSLGSRTARSCPQMLKIGKELYTMFQKGKVDVGGLMKIGQMAMS